MAWQHHILIYLVFKIVIKLKINENNCVALIGCGDQILGDFKLCVGEIDLFKKYFIFDIVFMFCLLPRMPGLFRRLANYRSLLKPLFGFFFKLLMFFCIFIIQLKMNAGWKNDESKLLNQLALRYKGKNWKMVASQLSNHGFHRTQTQCRYKWVNYVDPEINHQSWSEEELQKLFQGYQRHKSQWSLIQQSLPGRTQIRIRNQFYGTLRNMLRFSIKFFKVGNGKWSFISNQVKPQFLQNLYDGIQDFEFSGSLIRECIRKMNYKYGKEKFISLLVQNQEIFKEIVKKINNDQFFINNRVKKVDTQRQPNANNQERQNPLMNSVRLNSAPNHNQAMLYNENLQVSLQQTQMMMNPMRGLISMPSMPNVPYNHNTFYPINQNPEYQSYQFNQFNLPLMFQIPNTSANSVYLRPYQFLNPSNI